MEDVCIFCGHFVYFTTILFILRPFGHVYMLLYISPPPFWNVVPRKSGNPVTDLHENEEHVQDWVDAKQSGPLAAGLGDLEEGEELEAGVNQGAQSECDGSDLLSDFVKKTFSQTKRRKK
jgi:hypothetical protein